MRQRIVASFIVSICWTPFASLPAEGLLHAAVLPTQIDLKLDRWMTFYATLLNDSAHVANACSIAAEQPEIFDLVYVLTDPTNNQARSFKNPRLDIPPETHLTFRIRMRTRPGVTVQGREILFRFSCENVASPAKHVHLNRIAIKSVIPSATAQEVLRGLGCVETNYSVRSSEELCVSEPQPDSLAISRDRRLSSYHLCYEDDRGDIDRMFVIIKAQHGLSAHKCAVRKRDDGCSLSGGRFAWYSSPGFTGGGKAGYGCSYPAREDTEDTRRIMDSFEATRGAYQYGQPFCDDERCFWEKLDHSDLDELIESNR